MAPQSSELDPALWRRWAAAAATPEIDAALRRCYDDLAADIARRSPTCWISGKCCKFHSHGHLLYVTGLEIAWTVRRLDSSAMHRLKDFDPPGADGCPFQIDKMCSIHAIRPLGCRIYYCDPAAKEWQNPVYEMFLNRLRSLHDQQGLEYRYMEWREGLRQARSIMAR